MTGSKWVRKIGMLIATLLALAVGASVGVYFWFGDYLRGPDLTETPSAISLEDVFPRASGVDPVRVADALAYADEAGVTAVIVLTNGEIVAEFGDTSLESSLHSVRKSLLSALYGIAVDRGLIDITQTLSALGIDDAGPPLTDAERSATLRDLLTARSGIYHPSVKDDNGPYPDPSFHAPDEAFVYNNWSFNAAGGIFEELTGVRMGDAFAEWIAEPLGMQDFDAEDVRYFEGPESVFPAWRFWMSTRDLARFGQMIFDGGTWDGVRIVPSAWIEESLTAHSEIPNGTGYGYMWWTMPDSSYMATGTGGQKIRMYPARNTVIVTKVNTGSDFTRTLWWTMGPRVNNTDLREILERLGV
jgi:CubicO group peptidase (beta-lactamase class C family)